jgi:hypothetical protein
MIFIISPLFSVARQMELKNTTVTRNRGPIAHSMPILFNDVVIKGQITEGRI